MFNQLLSRRGLSLDRLQTLLELERAGSLAKAAPGDATRQTLYSRQMKQLSECFGVQLVRRAGRELKLTAEGRELAMIARESLGGLDDFQKRCAGKPLTLALGAGDSLLQWLLLPHLGAIQARLTGVKVRLHNLRTDAIVEGLLDSSLDLGLLREDATAKPLRKDRLIQLRYVIFVPLRLLPRGGQPDYRRVFQEVPLVEHTQRGQFAVRLGHLAGQEKVPLNFRLTCESFPQACRAVQSGHYAAILPDFAVAELDPSRFARIEWPALRTETRNICIAWNPRTHSLRPILEKFIAATKEVLADHEGVGQEWPLDKA